MQGLSSLGSSSKAIVVLAVQLGLGVLVALGKLDVDRFLHAVELLTPAWMASHAVQSAVEAVANRPPATSTPETTPPAAGS